MTKREFVKVCAEKTGLSVSKTEDVLNKILETLKEVTVKEGKLTLNNFGTFEVKERKAIVPQTKKAIKVKTVHFHAGKDFKKRARG